MVQDSDESASHDQNGAHVDCWLHLVTRKTAFLVDFLYSFIPNKRFVLYLCVEASLMRPGSRARRWT
jgi:hypothetical protein